MIGVELTDSTTALGFVTWALKRGLLVLAGGPNGTVISFTPPFVLAEFEIRWTVALFHEYLTSLPGSIS